ncbi:hypothetical protein ACH5RR_010815 [Cinchona calisaya]|uniref:RING-type E3 ubiquitin transferase n=1 Tax=Cinchona calisaya TaxID=153742 RepID=A0ABD3AJZ6_9GENT
MDEYSVKIDEEDCRPSLPHYSFNGRIMLVSVVILLIALIIIAFFPVYTRWFLLRRSRLRLHNHRLRRAHEVASIASSASTPHGLGPTVVKVLPTFAYSSKTHNSSLECAVCLSEFEDDETGRILPMCNHCFHVGCIDMWFQSHSNCPLCRAPVQNPDGTVVLDVQVQLPAETDPGSGLCPNYQRFEDQMGCSNSLVLTSLVEDRKLPELTTISVEAAVIRGGPGNFFSFCSQRGTRVVNNRMFGPDIKEFIPFFFFIF